MLQSRDFTANGVHFCRINFSNNEPDVFTAICQNFTPRINDQRMTIGQATALMLPTLSRGENKTSGFNRTNFMPIELGPRKVQSTFAN